jgi:hypothetical protein
VKGDPTIAIESYERTGPLARLFRVTPEDVAHQKTQRDELARHGFPVLEILEAGKFQGQPAALVRRHPGATYGPLVVRAGAAIFANVDPAVTLRELDALEARLVEKRSQGYSVVVGSLVITKEGHLLIDGGWIVKTGHPGTATEIERHDFDSVRRCARFVDGLVKSSVVPDAAEARALALDIFRPGAKAQVASPSVRDPRTATVSPLLDDLFRGFLGADLDATLGRHAAFEPQVQRALAVHPAAATRGEAEALGGR